MQSKRYHQALMYLLNQLLWLKVSHSPSAAMYVDLLHLRFSGWKTGESFPPLQAPKSHLLMAQPHWRWSVYLRQIRAITSARRPMMLVVSSARVKSLSKVLSFLREVQRLFTFTFLFYSYFSFCLFHVLHPNFATRLAKYQTLLIIIFVWSNFAFGLAVFWPLTEYCCLTKQMFLVHIYVYKWMSDCWVQPNLACLPFLSWLSYCSYSCASWKQ